MTPLNSEQLAKIFAKALRTIESLPQNESTAIAKLYCELRAAGESQARAELQTSADAGKVVRVITIREKNIWVRHGLDIGIDAWFDAYKQVVG